MPRCGKGLFGQTCPGACPSSVSCGQVSRGRMLGGSTGWPLEARSVCIPGTELLLSPDSSHCARRAQAEQGSAVGFDPQCPLSPLGTVLTQPAGAALGLSSSWGAARGLSDLCPQRRTAYCHAHKSRMKQARPRGEVQKPCCQALCGPPARAETPKPEPLTGLGGQATSAPAFLSRTLPRLTG